MNMGSIPLSLKRRLPDGKLVYESERGAWALVMPANIATLEIAGRRIEISIWAEPPLADPGEVDLLDGRTVSVERKKEE